MLRTLTAVSFVLATVLSPIAAEAQTSRSSAQILQVRPGGGGQQPGNFTPVTPGGAASKVDCGASNAHYALCTKIKATCDSIHENAPNHSCGCTNDADGNLGTCETGV